MKRHDLLKVPNDTVSNVKNVITQVSEKARVKRRLNQAGVALENVTREARARRPRQVLDL